MTTKLNKTIIVLIPWILLQLKTMAEESIDFYNSEVKTCWKLIELNPDTLILSDNGLIIDTDTAIYTETDTIEVVSRKKTPIQLAGRSAINFLNIPSIKKYTSWKFNSRCLENEIIEIDSLLWMNHLIYPQQQTYETYTFLGNLGSPSQYDHYFSRNQNRSTFLFARNYSDYSKKAIEKSHYNVRSPFTKLFYSTGGSRNEAEQVFSVLHTQNYDKHLNLGVTYDFYGTKGIYANQETRNNIISLYSSYYKGNTFLQTAFLNKVYNHNENGGILDHFFVEDTTIMTSKAIPVWLPDANSILRERSISLVGGYVLMNRKQSIKKEDGRNEEVYVPLISTMLIFNQENHSRVFTHKTSDSSYFPNTYINPIATYDTVSLKQWKGKAVFEIAQFSSFPGMPGLRGWIGYEYLNTYFFRPENFIYSRDKNINSTSHVGLAAFSDSPYFSYRGTIRIFFSGYRADDKEIFGKLRLSPWRNPEMPQLKGRIQISEATPDLFLQNYFSNHLKWDNKLDKEKKFMLGGSLEAEKWEAEVGYNLMHIVDYLYFNEFSIPHQVSDVTITSAYIQKNLKVLKGLNFFNRLVWQTNTNTDVLSLPNLIIFSALFYERVLVPNALTGQFGVNVFYRSKFYADAYQPATGQFYNQRVKRIGNYPVVDVFANFKWKRAILYFKYEHANQGFPNNQYFATYLHPMNPQVLKFGVSWMFYD